MNIYESLKYRRRRGRLGALLLKKPVLVLGLDLPFVIACATSLKTAVALSIVMFFVHMVTMCTALLTVRQLSVIPRTLVNIAMATIAMTAGRYLAVLIFPEITNNVGMYIYLLAVNGLTTFQSASVTRKMPPLRVLFFALVDVLSFALIMTVVSFVRELFGNGTLWGIPIQLPFKLPGLIIPFGGFILVAFMLALFKLLSKKLTAFTISEAIRSDSRYIDL